MSRPLRVTLLLSAVGSLIVLGAWWYRHLEIGYFKVALARADMPTQGSLSELRLAYAQTMARNNPLVALPGINPDVLVSKVEDLRDLADELATLQNTPQEQGWIHALYPTEFLIAVAELERARLAFVTSGTKTNQERYERAQGVAIENYYSDLADFKRAYLAAVPKDVGAFATPTRIIRRDTTLAAFDTIYSGMRATARTAAARNACVRGYFLRCSERDTTPPTTATTAITPTTTDTLEHQVQSALATAGYSFSKTSERFALPNAACVRYTASRPATFIIDAGTATLANDAVLIRIDKDSSNAKLPFAKYFLDRGNAYIPVRPLMYYQCPESDVDFGDLLAAAAGDVSKTTLERWTHSLGLVAVIDDILRAERDNAMLQRHGIDMGLRAKDLFFARSAMPVLFLANNPSATGTHAPLYPPNNLPHDKQLYVWYSDSTLSTTQLAQSFTLFKQLYVSRR